MDSAALKHSLKSVYIPPSNRPASTQVPNYHPCLIVQDLQTDINKVKPCGCADVYCVKNAPLWIPQAK